MLVSVYMPTRNREKLLKRAVESVLNQSYTELELIVVNDGSTDGTRAYLDNMLVNDLRLRVIHNSESIGAPASRNIAICASKGEFLTGLDDDDYFHPKRIEAFISYWQILEKTGATFSCIFSQDISEKNSYKVSSSRPGSVVWEDLFFCNVIGNQIFAKRKTFLDSNLFDPDMPAWQDLDLFIRILRKFGPARLLDASLYFQNIDPNLKRISTTSKETTKKAFNHLSKKWNSCPKVMLQALYLHRFSHYYGIKPNIFEVFKFLAMGINPRTLKTLAGIYLRKNI